MKPTTYTITSIYGDPSCNLISTHSGVNRARMRIAECKAMIEHDRTRNLGTGKNAESPMIAYTVSPSIE